MKKILTLSVASIAAAIALAGCSTGSGGSMPGMNMGGSDTSTESAPIAAGDHNGADTTFAQMMIPHHKQALEMSDLMLKKQGLNPKVTALATKIKTEQGPEITTMTNWLKSWNEAPQMSGSGMSGTMSAEDMAKLEAAQGTEIGRAHV